MLDWIWAETGMDWTGQDFGRKCDTFRRSDKTYTIETSPFPATVSQSDCVHTWSSSTRLLFQATSIRWTRIQSSVCVKFSIWVCQIFNVGVPMSILVSVPISNVLVGLGLA